jgi:hypothetical protein
VSTADNDHSCGSPGRRACEYGDAGSANSGLA